MAEVKLKKDRCKGCELCILYCPTKHLGLSKDLNKKGFTFIQIKEGSKCTGCGLCFLMCPDNCIEIYENSD
jgi:2-oxoglutarate ferredoxin oxidoreductase subunit delta